MLSTSIFILGICVAFVGLLLVAIPGLSIPEWTCEEEGGAWKCVGPRCNIDALNHFAIARRSYSCTRTDWPMSLITSLGKTKRDVTGKGDNEKRGQAKKGDGGN